MDYLHYSLNQNHGILEVYTGPMKSGKTRELINRVDKLNFIDDYKFLFFKPKVDIRDETVESRFGSLKYDCKFIDEYNPSEIKSHIDEKTRLVIIDEVQFFDQSISKIVIELLKNNINVIVSGLDLDFRGKPFGSMPEILSLADKVNKLTGVCEYPNCTRPATRTQRLIDGKPAPFDSPTILIDSKNEDYECRCISHHFIE